MSTAKAIGAKAIGAKAMGAKAGAKMAGAKKKEKDVALHGEPDEDEEEEDGTEAGGEEGGEDKDATSDGVCICGTASPTRSHADSSGIVGNSC
jgi:hypothetical protein